MFCLASALADEFEKVPSRLNRMYVPARFFHQNLVSKGCVGHPPQQQLDPFIILPKGSFIPPILQRSLSFNDDPRRHPHKEFVELIIEVDLKDACLVS